MTKIKICGLSRDEDIAAVNATRPDFAGFIVNVPFSHRSVSIARAAQLTGALDQHIRSVGVFFDAAPEEIARAVKQARFDIVQLHGHETDQDIEVLRELLPKGCAIWKAFKVEGPETLRAATQCPADMVLLDGGTGEGRTFDWSLARDFTDRAFVLAGGLAPETIPAAIATVGPWVVDLSSGVETDQRKDAHKIEAAVAAARETSAADASAARKERA